MSACACHLRVRPLSASDTPLVAPPYLSPSSISTFQQCPLKYKYSRIDGLTEPPTEATLRGNFVHSILETLYGLPSEERTIETAKQLAKSLWDDEYHDKALELTRSAKALQMFRWTSWWCVENLFGMENPNELHFDGIETQLDDAINGVTIKGFIDRWHEVDGGIVVGDYKTGKTPAPRFREDKFFQLCLYGYVLEQQLGKPVVELELLYIKDSIKLSHTVKPEDMAEVKKVVTEVREQIDSRCASGVFEPTPNRLCDWCAYKSICPSWSK